MLFRKKQWCQVIQVRTNQLILKSYWCKIIIIITLLLITYILCDSKWRVVSVWDGGENSNQSKESLRELKKNMEWGILYWCSEVSCIVYGMPLQVLLKCMCLCVCLLGQCTCKGVTCVLLKFKRDFSLKKCSCSFFFRLSGLLCDGHLRLLMLSADLFILNTDIHQLWSNVFKPHIYPA